MVRLVLALCVVLLPTTIARAEPQRAMEQYFSGEKTGGWILVGMGAAGLGAGTVLVLQDDPVLNGAAYPLLGIGLAHVAAGLYVRVASQNRVEDFTEQIARDPAAFVAEESERMRGVSRTFSVLKIVEGILIAGGITLAVVGHRTDRPRLKGIGVGIAVEAAGTLAFDIFAARRASAYREQLAIPLAIGVDADGAATAMLVHAGTF